ncbi:MAG TPA: 4-alpha-glucanotransferase, partial [Pirellulales bacterium]|nr:4-alpha-glucanotransferase [Pirellulales bacterium]
QWLLDEQLARAASELPFVQDLPIGIDPGGADAWVWQDVLASGCSVGAPPDMLNTQGQDWGLPPFIPHKLRSAGYRPFIETIRATLRHSAGLRIDHVMGLFRLYWIPQGFGADRGAFVRYQADELLAIVALESQRAGAFVVGEDLGTVEPGVREAMTEHGMLSYRVLWMEDEPPEEYPELAMVAVTTHDLPTIAGILSGSDLAAQRSLGLAPNEAAMRRLREKLDEFAGPRRSAAHRGLDCRDAPAFSSGAFADSFRHARRSAGSRRAAEHAQHHQRSVARLVAWPARRPGGDRSGAVGEIDRRDLQRSDKSLCRLAARTRRLTSAFSSSANRGEKIRQLRRGARPQIAVDAVGRQMSQGRAAADRRLPQHVVVGFAAGLVAKYGREVRGQHDRRFAANHFVDRDFRQI